MGGNTHRQGIGAGYIVLSIDFHRFRFTSRGRMPDAKCGTWRSSHRAHKRGRSLWDGRPVLSQDDAHGDKHRTNPIHRIDAFAVNEISQHWHKDNAYPNPWIGDG